MKYDRINIFCSVAKHMSFTKAADECHVAQSAVSQQINALEKELGFPLFRRSTRQVTFTDAGQKFYIDCLRILREYDSAVENAAAYHNGKSFTLSVGIEGHMQSLVRAKDLTEFKKRNPNIQIVYIPVDRDNKYQDLLIGNVDTLFDITQYYLLNPKIKQCGMHKTTHCVMVGKNHPLANKKVVSKAELSQYTTFWGGIPMVEDYVINLYKEYFRSSNIPASNIIAVPDQNVSLFMTLMNEGACIVPFEEKYYWSTDTFSFVDLDEQLVLNSAWLYSSENLNPALSQFVSMFDGK